MHFVQKLSMGNASCTSENFGGFSLAIILCARGHLTIFLGILAHNTMEIKIARGCRENHQQSH